MLISFTVKNYLSFKDSVSLHLSAAQIRELDQENTFKLEQFDMRMLKSVGFYGANSSGKSNLIRALSFMTRFILKSSKDKQANEKIPVENFKLSTETEFRPCTFEIVFIIDAIKYRYGFEVDEQRVHSESLFWTKKNKEQLLFSRKLDEFELSSDFLAAEKLRSLTRDNALFLSVVAQFNGKIATEILEWIQKIKFMHDFDDRRHINRTAQLLNDDKYRRLINKFLQAVDLGFAEVTASKIDLPNELDINKNFFDFILHNKKHEYIIKTAHIKYDKNNKPTENVVFNLMKNESLGTQKYFGMVGQIIETLVNGSILIVDEFDSRMHPILSRFIVKLFNSQKNNPKNAQLIFATHNTSLLDKDILRRDQILLFKKNAAGATEFLSLHDKNVRNDASYQKNYLEGKYDSVAEVKEINLFED